MNPECGASGLSCERASHALLNQAGIPYFQFVFAARRSRNLQRQLVPRSRPRLRKNPQPTTRASKLWQSRLIAVSKFIQQPNPQDVLSCLDRKQYHDVLIALARFHLERNRVAVQIYFLHFSLQADCWPKLDRTLVAARSEASLQHNSLIPFHIIEQKCVLPDPHILDAESIPIPRTMRPPLPAPMDPIHLPPPPPPPHTPCH